MKHSLITILTFSIMLFACKKDEEVAVPSRYYGTVTALRNGIPWTANVYSFIDTFSGLRDRWGVVFDAYGPGGDLGSNSFIQHSLGFHNLRYQQYRTEIDSAREDYTRVRLFTNENEFGAYYEKEQYDIVRGSYSIVMGEPHWFEITSIDKSANQLTGRFAISSYLNLPGLQDTVRFTNGQFSTRYPGD